jgi:hypothetical protein
MMPASVRVSSTSVHPVCGAFDRPRE